MATLDRTASFPNLISSRLRGRSGLWITFREAFWVALEALHAHKLRSFLTLLGIIIATTTLIVVMSIINGMNLYISEHLANLGANVFIVNRFQWAQGYQAWLAAHRRNKPIRVEDFEFLRDNLTGYKNIGVRDDMQNDNNFVRYQGHTKYSQDIEGVSPSMIDIGSQKVESGRYVNDSDYDHESMVCLIGHDLVDEFFANSDPLGKEILINNLPFRVIGTTERIGNTFGESQDNFVIVPMTAYLKFFVPHPTDVDINVQAYDGAQMLALQDETRALLRARRHVPYKESDNFGINASQTIMDLWNRLLGSIFAVTIGIVSVFMLVGGIVIMNIMLASVTERTHEIGIRKSLGARRADILAQFVMESIVMSGVGGAIGVLLAFAVSAIVDRYWTSSVPLRAVLFGLGLSSAVGLFFGIYPASQAAKLNPIDALRTET